MDEREQHIYKTMAHRRCNFPPVDKKAYDNDLVVFLYVNRSLSFFLFFLGAKMRGNFHRQCLRYLNPVVPKFDSSEKGSRNSHRLRQNECRKTQQQ